MRTLLVAYDLARPLANRADVAQVLMSLGDQWARPLDNVWYLRTEAAAAEIEGRLASSLGDDDGLIVQEARGEAVMANTGLRWFRRRRVDAVVVPFPAAPHQHGLDNAAATVQHLPERLAG